MIGAPLHLHPWTARACLGGGLGLVVLGLVQSGLPTSAPAGSGGQPGDVALYQRIAGRVAAGQPYYPSAIAEQAAGGYPTTPAMAVRPPTLTLLEAALGSGALSGALFILSLAAAVALIIRLGKDGATAIEQTAAGVVLSTGVALTLVGPVAWFHEVWAAALVIAAIAVYSPSRWWPSLLLGLTATSLREFAALFLLLMAVAAWRRRRELLGWLIGLALLAVAYLAHALAVAGAQPATPVPSPGWLAWGQWTFVLSSVRFSSALSALPLAVTAVLVPLGLIGWLGAGATGRRALAFCLGCCAFSLVAGRPENTYWGLIYAGLLLAGLAFTPRALRALWRASSAAATGSG